jgi:hypothetical protein
MLKKKALFLMTKIGVVILFLILLLPVFGKKAPRGEVGK